MNIEIVSIQAALAGRASITWTGVIESTDLAPLLPGPATPESEAEINNALFRFFNVVDGDDVERLHAIGYELPSLSVGDLLCWGSKTWRVAGLGFDCITGSNEYAVALAMYTADTMNGADDEGVADQ